MKTLVETKSETLEQIRFQLSLISLASHAEPEQTQCLQTILEKSTQFAAVNWELEQQALPKDN